MTDGRIVRLPDWAADTRCELAIDHAPVLLAARRGAIELDLGLMRRDTSAQDQTARFRFEDVVLVRT